MAWRLSVTGPAELIRGQSTPAQVAALDDVDAPGTPSAWSAALTLAGRAIADSSGTGAASWTITPSEDWALSDGYLITWTVTIGGGVLTTRQPALVCATSIAKVLRLDDVWTRERRFDPTAPNRIIDDADDLKALLARHRADAWRDILDRLRGQGRRPHLIVDAYALREVHLCRTLASLYRSLITELGGEYVAQAEHYEEESGRRWAALALSYVQDVETPSAPSGPETRPPLYAGGANEHPIPARGSYVAPRHRYLPAGWRR